MMGTFSSSPAKNVPIGCLVCDLPGHEWAERAGNRGGPLGIQGVEDNLEGHRVIGDIRVGAEVQRADVLDDNVLGPGLIDEGAVPRKYSVVVPGGDDGVLNTGDGHSIRVEFLEECGAPQLLGQGSQCAAALRTVLSGFPLSLTSFSRPRRLVPLLEGTKPTR